MGHFTLASGEKAIQDTGDQVKAELVERVQYVGLVHKTNTGYTLLVETRLFLLEGENLEKLVGQIAKINGELIKGNKIDTIFVVRSAIA